MVTGITQDFWNGDNGFIPNLLKFFDTGRPPAPQAETLEIAALLEAAQKAAVRPHKWIAVPGRDNPTF